MLREKYLPKLHWFLHCLIVFFVLVAFWLFMAYFLPKVLPVVNVSNTSKAGFIFRNERWRGDIHIVGDIFALPGTTVIIEPGTRILVADRGDKSNLHFLPWEMMSGLNTKEDKFGVRNGELFWDEGQKISLNFAKLYALGTKEQPIIIQSEASYERSPYDFNRITVDQGVLSFIQLSNYRRLEIGDKVTARDSEFKNIAECAICIEYGNPAIINNTFENALREYIWILSGSPRISDNLFLKNSYKGKGIVVDPKRFGSPIFYHNNFEMPGQMAVEFLSGDEDLGAAISFNDFAGDSIIKIPCDSKVKITQNQIKGRLQFAHSGNCLGSFTLEPNYWLSNEKEAIFREKIVDKEVGFKILMPAILNNPPVKVGRRS